MNAINMIKDLHSSQYQAMSTEPEWPITKKFVDPETNQPWLVMIRDPKENDYKQEPIVRWYDCLLYTSPSPRDRTRSRMPSSA